MQLIASNVMDSSNGKSSFLKTFVTNGEQKEICTGVLSTSL